MSKKQEFIEFVEKLMAELNIGPEDMSENVCLYFEALRSKDEIDKPLFTDNGKIILQFLREHSETDMWRARDIGEGLFISSRTVSGAMRKLIIDGFVESVSKSPTIYTLTEKGKNIEII